MMQRHVRLYLSERVAVTGGAAWDLNETSVIRQPLLCATAEQQEFVGG